ncbi:MAG: hypothetical protein ABSD72_05705 [Terracidiphilus sp.]|jgi:hypothetical protein
MKKLAVLSILAVSVALVPVQAPASTLAPTSVAAKQASDAATQTKLLKAAPAAAPTPDSARKSLAFEVNDVKGLLLTCVAPQLDTDPNTDIFKSCTLAPGRTLDDVMHTFIQAIHFIQNEQLKERAEWNKEREERSGRDSAQK